MRRPGTRKRQPAGLLVTPWVGETDQVFVENPLNVVLERMNDSEWQLRILCADGRFVFVSVAAKRAPVTAAVEIDP